MVTALGVGGKLGALGLMLHMTFHTVAKPLLFLCAGNVYQQFKTDLFAKIKGGVIRTHAGDRRRVPDGDAGHHRHAAVQPVSERIPDRARRLRRRPLCLGRALFVLFGAGIFAGALLHVGGLVLGAGGRRSRSRASSLARLPDAGAGRGPGRDRVLAARAAARADSRRGARRDGRLAMQHCARTSAECASWPGRTAVDPAPGQVYAARGPGRRARDRRTLLEAHAARLVAVFAEDRVAAEGVFYNYYVFEQPRRSLLPDPAGAHSGRRRRASPRSPPELPAVNWQEREIQDWFGIEAEGHPNPRRVALHDNWPDVHPLRKDFPLDTVLPPFEGEQHVYRPTLGEGVFQIPVGPVHAGIIEPGHFNFAVAGEPILYLQLRMFYTHKGTEKLFEQLPVAQGRVPGRKHLRAIRRSRTARRSARRSKRRPQSRFRSAPQ